MSANIYFNIYAAFHSREAVQAFLESLQNDVTPQLGQCVSGSLKNNFSWSRLFRKVRMTRDYNHCS